MHGTRAFTALLLVCVSGCFASDGRDPCARRKSESSRCGHDAGRIEDAGNSAPDGQVAGDSDAGGDADLDAGPDASVDEDRDAAMDSAVEDPEDAATPDAGSLPEPQVLALEGDLGVHDPTIIQADGQYFIFSTGAGVQVKRSTDLLTWTNAGSVFATNPEWIAQEVPGATHLWAPDIAYFGGLYHLYYSASTFGSRNSCIGHATATDLSAMDFVDHGPVICTEETDDYNAIDPGVVLDEDGTAWLSFGSFWTGIKLIRLDADGARDGSELHALASRDAVGAIEAPYLIRRGNYYYLFVSFDLCCRGTASTYRIMVGRSTNVTGPYVDQSGKPMLSSGGGTQVVLGNQRWRGPGHNAVLTDGEAQYLVYHAYDASNNGEATLRIAELLWDSAGWPIPAGP